MEAVKVKPTPGPWKVASNALPKEYVIGRDNLTVCKIEEWRPGAEQEANAHLISAAPDLLEALKKAAQELNEIRARDGVPYTHQGWQASVTEEYFSSVVDEGFSAIAKAEGRTE